MTEDIRQHKNMAMGNALDSGTFGIEPLAGHAHKKKHPDGGKPVQKEVMKDGKRGAAPPVGGGKGMNQAQPDHGPADYM